MSACWHGSAVFFKCPLMGHSSLGGALKTQSRSMHKAALSKSRLHIYEMHISVTKNYMKLIVNKLCFIM
jgi:hypothetical protein